MKRRRLEQLGVTLVETAVAAVGTAVVLGLTATGMMSVMTTWGAAAADSVQTRGVADVIDGLVGELTDAAPDSIADSLPNPFGGQSITFRRRIGFENGTDTLGPEITLAWLPDPADPTDGVDNDGDGLVDEGRAVRISGGEVSLLAKDVPLFENTDEIQVLGANKTGLAFLLKNSVLKVRITIAKIAADGTLVHTTRQAVVKLEK